MTLENYIASLKGLKSNIPKKVDEIIIKNKQFIVGMLKQRLYIYGTDGNYDLIGQYAKNTLAIKKANNQKTDFITLRDTGRFYAGMYLDVSNNEYSIDSTDRKTALLVDVYGSAILELTYKQQTDIIQNIIEPELQKYLDELTSEISIDI